MKNLLISPLSLKWLSLIKLEPIICVKIRKLTAHEKKIRTKICNINYIGEVISRKFLHSKILKYFPDFCKKLLIIMEPVELFNSLHPAHIKMYPNIILILKFLNKNNFLNSTTIILQHECIFCINNPWGCAKHIEVDLSHATLNIEIETFKFSKKISKIRSDKDISIDSFMRFKKNFSKHSKEEQTFLKALINSLPFNSWWIIEQSNCEYCNMYTICNIHQLLTKIVRRYGIFW